MNSKHGGDGIQFGGGFRRNPREVPGMVFQPDEYALRNEAELLARQEQERKLDASARNVGPKGPKQRLIKKGTIP